MEAQPSLASLTVDVWPNLLSRGQMIRRGESRWAVLLPPALVGASVMVLGNAPTHRWAVHLLTLLLAISAHALIVRLPRRSAAFDLIPPFAALVLITLTLAAQGLEGVHRWVSIGPLLIHPSALFAPLLLIACAKLAGSRSTLAALVLVGAQALHFFQPDAGQATAFGIAALFVPLRHGPIGRGCTRVLLLSFACAVWHAADPLAPMPFVEDILQRAFSLGPGVGLLAVAGVMLYALSPLCAPRATSEGTRLRRMLSCYFGLTVFVSFLGEFPVPVVGYGPSPILGAFLGVAMLARAERALLASPSTSSADSDETPTDTTVPIRGCAANAFGS